MSSACHLLRLRLLCARGPIATAALGLLCATGFGCASGGAGPWVVNRTGQSVQIQSTYSDGHTLRTVLAPGARFALGSSAATLDSLAVLQGNSRSQQISDADVRSCLAPSPWEVCSGWIVSALGIEPLRQVTPSSAERDERSAPRRWHRRRRR